MDELSNVKKSLLIGGVKPPPLGVGEDVNEREKIMNRLELEKEFVDRMHKYIAERFKEVD